MSIQDHAQAISQETVGKVAIAIGGGGSVLQMATEWASLAATMGNLILVGGGLYLMYHKIFDKRRNRRGNDTTE